MDILFEQRLIQNSALSMQILHIVINTFYLEKNKTQGLEFPLVFIVLPFIYQRKIVNTFYKRKGKGMLYRTIIENPELFIGFQSRMEIYFEQTMSAISLGLNSNMFELSNGMLYPCSNKKFAQPNGLVQMFRSAKRLGKSFAESNIEEISQFLKIVF